VPCAERGEDLLGIVTDGGEAEARGAKVGETILQLDELSAAVWSPVRGAIKHDHRAVRPITDDSVHGLPC
jgi:hypothetical protein